MTTLAHPTPASATLPEAARLAWVRLRTLSGTGVPWWMVAPIWALSTVAAVTMDPAELPGPGGLAGELAHLALLMLPLVGAPLPASMRHLPWTPVAYLRATGLLMIVALAPTVAALAWLDSPRMLPIATALLATVVPAFTRRPLDHGESAPTRRIALGALLWTAMVVGVPALTLAAAAVAAVVGPWVDVPPERSAHTGEAPAWRRLPMLGFGPDAPSRTSLAQIAQVTLARTLVVRVPIAVLAYVVTQWAGRVWGAPLLLLLLLLSMRVLATPGEPTEGFAPRMHLPTSTRALLWAGLLDTSLNAMLLVAAASVVVPQVDWRIPMAYAALTLFAPFAGGARALPTVQPWWATRPRWLALVGVPFALGALAVPCVDSLGWHDLGLSLLIVTLAGGAGAATWFTLNLGVRVWRAARPATDAPVEVPR